MSLLKLILKKATPISKLESYSNFLFIGPHPDDIEIGCGATVSKLVSLKKKVSFLICIDGRYGFDNAPDTISEEELISIRKKEAIESAHFLGVEDVHFLDLCDGGFYDTTVLRQGIAKQISTSNADVVFTVDPDVSSECHIDHINVGRESKIVANFANNNHIMKALGAQKTSLKQIAFYMTDKPNYYVKTTGHVKKQLKAIFDFHKSQFPLACKDSSSITLYIKLKALFFGLKSFKGHAEGFRVLEKIHMHCMPEKS